VAYHAGRTLMTFRGLVRLRVVVRRRRNSVCELYHWPYRSEEEGAWALPHGEFGLDIFTSTLGNLSGVTGDINERVEERLGRMDRPQS